MRRHFVRTQATQSASVAIRRMANGAHRVVDSRARTISQRTTNCNTCYARMKARATRGRTRAVGTQTTRSATPGRSTHLVRVKSNSMSNYWAPSSRMTYVTTRSSFPSRPTPMMSLRFRWNGSVVPQQRSCKAVACLKRLASTPWAVARSTRAAKDKTSTF